MPKYGMINLKKCSPYEVEVSALIDELDHYQGNLYPEASRYHDSRETLNHENCHFLAAYEGETLSGIGAVKLFDGYGEIKRLYVPERARGQGIARLIMQELERYLVNQHIDLSRLETGMYHLEAINMYLHLGYIKTTRFGDYGPDPLSVFMEKELIKPK